MDFKIDQTFCPRQRRLGRTRTLIQKQPFGDKRLLIVIVTATKFFSFIILFKADLNIVDRGIDFFL